MATLKMIVSGRPPVIVPLGTELVIGRSEDADLSVPDGGVSRRHAVIKLTTNGYVIEDLGSRNGTYVNGNKMTEHALSDRDRIEICSARFIFLVEEATASSILLQDAEPPNILGSVKVEPGQTPLGQVREEALAHIERRLKIFH